jgi:hypothetical protein
MNQSNDVVVNLLPGLSAIAGHRDLITTPELAKLLNVSPQTIRKNYCLSGHCYGLKPVKLGNKLLWTVQSITQVMQVQS